MWVILKYVDPVLKEASLKAIQVKIVTLTMINRDK